MYSLSAVKVKVPDTTRCDHLGGPKRRKITRTTINDRGEEVTEEVWEETQEASASEQQTDEANAAQPQGSPADSSAANSPASKGPARASEDVALKEQPGQQGHSTIFACQIVSTVVNICIYIYTHIYTHCPNVTCNLPRRQPPRLQLPTSFKDVS